MTWVLVLYLATFTSGSAYIMPVSGAFLSAAPQGQRVEVAMPDRETCERIAALNTINNAECWGKLEKKK